MSDLNNLKKRIDLISALNSIVDQNDTTYLSVDWITNNIFGDKSKIRKYKIKSIFK